MGFSILIKTPYVDIDAFYPHEKWERHDSEDYKDLIRRCLAVDPGNEDELEKLIDIISDPGKDNLSNVAFALSGCDAVIEVNDVEIQNPFADHTKYEVPEPEELIPGIINSEFCYIKCWENSGGWTYKGNGDYDASKLTWEKGRFLYEGNEFELLGGDGSSSYGRFYKEGIEVSCHG
jgi:hypothetical protein